MKPFNRFFILSLLLLFFLSGVAGLIYESIWTHYLKLFVGHAAYAQMLVLVIYMGGMALGSWIASKYTGRVRQLLPAYAITEIVIGLTALLFHQVFVGYLAFSYDTVFPALDSAILISLYKWITAPLLILPQTILLGATFPLIAGGIVRRESTTPGRTFSVLYFVNSLGGALGVLISGFWLIEKFTFPGTVKFAGIIDIVVGAGVLALFFFSREPQTTATKKKKSEANVLPASDRRADAPARIFLLIAGATAASSFIYEVGWVRMLSLVLGSSTHSFELMLSAFILGLAIGGFWIKNRLDSIRNPLFALAKIQLLMGACAIATLPLYSNLFYLMDFFLKTLTRSEQGYVMFHIYSHVLCLILMLPATILAGMTLPLITAYLYKTTSDEAVIGKVYAFNTLGSIVGVVLAVQLLLPYTGLKCLLIIGGAIDMVIGCYLLYRFREHSKKYALVLFSAFTLVAVLLPSVFVRFDPHVLSSGIYRFGRVRQNGKVLYYRDGKTASVSLLSKNNCMSLSTNGKTDATISTDSLDVDADEFTQSLLATYPLSYARSCRNIGVIGLGSGMTASTLLESDSVQKLDVVEIEPCILEAARLMGPKTRKVFTDKRSSIHIDDAKTFFSAHRKKYDIIISEPSNPWVSGVSSLFSVEFFSLISKHLTPDGMLVQWFHLYEMDPSLVASIIMSIDGSFSDYKAFDCGMDIIILASNSPITTTPFDRVFNIPVIAGRLKKTGIEHGYDFTSNFIGGKKSLYYLVGMFDIPVNSDYNPVLDLRAIKSRILFSTADEFSRYGGFVIPVRRHLEGETDTIPHATFGRLLDPRIAPISNVNADREAWQGWHYISTIGTPQESSVDSAISRRVGLKVAVVRMAARDSSLAARQIWPKYVIDLLKITMPYLPAEKMKDIWAFIDHEGAGLSLPPKSRDMLAVLRHVSLNNDFKTARVLSRRLLGEGAVADDEYNRMLVAAFLLSSIKTGDFGGIDDLWRRIGPMRSDFNLMMLYGYIYVHRS